MSTSDKDKASEGGFGSRLISGLKDLILEDEAPAPEKTAADGSAAGQKPAQNAGPYAPSMASSPALTVSSPMTASLLEQVLNRATAFTALNEALKPLEEIIPDEMTRYRAAFAVIKKNRSLDQVIQAIDFQHLHMLEDEVTRFAAQAKQKENSDINVRVTEAATLKDNVQAATEQIVKLRDETEKRIRIVEEAMQRDRTRMDEIERELLEKRQAIALVQNQFNSAVASVKDSLLQDKAKIFKYLSS
jgi:hypothetical protein